jgi:hypothetical protein
MRPSPLLLACLSAFRQPFGRRPSPRKEGPLTTSMPDLRRSRRESVSARVWAGCAGRTAFVAAVAMAGCTEPIPPLDPASITLSATSVAFMATYGSAAPPPQSVEVGNGGEEELSGLRVNAGSGWLSASLTSTRAPSTLTIWVDVSGLPVGTHSGSVEIDSGVASNGPRTVSVMLQITATPPSASTGAATGVTSSAATLHGTVNPNGFATNAWFEWGTDPALAGAAGTLEQSVGSGAADLPTSAALNGLTPNTTYYFRAVAAGPGGVARGSIASFTTLPPASITLSATSAAFTADEGGGNPPSIDILVTNGGAGALTGLAASVASGAGWLSATLGSTTAPATLTLAVNTAGLTVGSYSATVEVSSPVAGNSPQSIGVTLEITIKRPTVTTAPATEVTTDGATLNGSVNPNGSATQAWFEYGTSPSLSSFSSTSEESVGSGSAAVPVDAGLSGLSPGITYYFRAAARNEGGTQRGGIHSFTIEDRPRIRLSDSRLSFTSDNRSGETKPETVEITNSGGGTLSGLEVTVLDEVPWLGVELSSDTAPATLWVYASGANMNPGTYSATIEVSSPVASNSPRTITVELTVVQAGAEVAMGAPEGRESRYDGSGWVVGRGFRGPRTGPAPREPGNCGFCSWIATKPAWGSATGLD